VNVKPLLGHALILLTFTGQLLAQGSGATFESIGVESYRVQFTQPVPDAPLLMEAPYFSISAPYRWTRESGLQLLTTETRNLGQINSSGTLITLGARNAVFSLETLSEHPLPRPPIPAGQSFYTMEVSGFLGAKQVAGMYSTLEPLPNGFNRVRERAFIFDRDIQTFQYLPLNADNEPTHWRWTAFNRTGTLGLLMPRVLSNPASSLRLWGPEDIGPVFHLDVKPFIQSGQFAHFVVGMAPSSAWAFFQAATPNLFGISSSGSRFSRFSFAGVTEGIVVQTSPLASALHNSSVLGITDDGTAFGSVTLNRLFSEACLWLPNGARVNLKRELERQFGLNLAGWELSSVEDVSPDGLLLCGRGRNPSGRWDTWIVQLPSPLEEQPPVPCVTLVSETLESFTSVTVAQFASVSAGSSRTRDCFIVNQGAAPLEISALAWSGANTADFSLPPVELPLILPPGTSKRLPITFSPLLTGLKQASLHLSTNDTDNPETVFHFSGLGPEPRLYVSGVAEIFRPLQGTTHLRFVRVTNNGTMTLTGLSLELTGNAFFSIPAHQLTDIPVNGYVDVPIQFSPAAAGTFSAQLKVYGAHSPDPALTHNLNYTARAPAPFTITNPSGQILPSQNPAFDLGSVTIGSDFVQPFVITTSVWSLSGLRFRVSIEGPDASEFVVGVPLPVVESQAFAGSPKTLTVVYRPSSPGPKQAWLVIDNESSFTVETQQFVTPYRIQLTAQALAPSPPAFFFHTPAASSLNGSTSVRFRLIGTPSLRYRVLEDNIPGPWQTAPIESTLTITPSNLERGKMRLELNNEFGSALGPEFHIGLFSPSLPANLTLAQGSPLQLECSASGPDLEFQWLRSGNPLHEDEAFQGSRTRSLRVPNIQPEDEGAYSCRVTLNSPTGPIIRETSKSTVRVTTPLQVMPFSLRPVRAQEAIAFNFEATDAPHRRQYAEASRFSIQGLPPGLRNDSRSGFVYGIISQAAARSQPKTYTVTVRARSATGWSLPIVAEWTVEPYLPFAGSYLGLLDRYDSEARSSSLAGRVSCTVTASGRYTGRVTAGGISQSISGPILSASPSSTSTSTSYNPPLPPGLGERTPLPTAYVPWITMPGLGYPEMALSFDGWLMGGLLVGEYQDGYISGAKRVSASQVAASTYHLQFTVPPSVPDAPQGHGYLASTFRPSGAVTFKGRLPDGTPFSGSTATVQFADVGPWGVPLYQILYSRLGSAYGWIVKHPSQPDLIAAELDWLRGYVPEKSAVRAYRDGFHIEQLPGEGSLFLPPPAGSLFHDFSPADSPSNASLQLSGGFLSQPWRSDLNLTTKGVLTQTLSPDPTGSLKLKYQPRNGLLSGSTSITEGGVPARSGNFGALWIPHLKTMGGYFNLPESPSKKSAIRSGKALLTPIPAAPPELEP
jgi:Immunoglobulin I-set domain/Abnormal spindle-like microcephaly-assoc'd, ASPM-SPD-2-Hydin